MKTSTFSLSRHRQQGFSLFEMLLTVCIIGVLCSLAIPLFGAPREAVEEIKAKRNAQELVNECQKAQVAGVDFVVAGDVAATLANVARGEVASSGAFAGVSFGLKGLAVGELQEAERWLQLHGGCLLMR